MPTSKTSMVSEVRHFDPVRAKAWVRHHLGGWRGPAVGARPFAGEHGGDLLRMMVADLLGRRHSAALLNDLCLVQRALIRYLHSIGDDADALRQEQILTVIELAANHEWRRCPPSHVQAAASRDFNARSAAWAKATRALWSSPVDWCLA